MNLTELIEEFKEASGRLDLSDDGITNYINRGSRLLDRRRKGDRFESRAFASIQPGSYVITLDPDLRSISTVYAATADRRWELSLIELQEMRKFYNTQPVGVEQADPIQYALTTVTLGPGGASDGQTMQDDFFPQWSNDLMFSNNQGFRGLVVYPIPREVTTVEVFGSYYTSKLIQEVSRDTNWWSLNHPHLLIQAGLMALDINYRNTSGAKEVYSFIDDELQQIYFDEVEEDYKKPSKMEG